jgi:hypothetical protein
MILCLLRFHHLSTLNFNVLDRQGADIVALQQLSICFLLFVQEV